MSYDLACSYIPKTFFEPLKENVNGLEHQINSKQSLFLCWVIAPLMNIQTMIQNNTDNILIQKISAVFFGAVSAIASVVLGLAEGCIRFLLDVTIGCVVTNNRFLTQTAVYNLALSFFVCDLAIRRMDIQV
jgi:hypothetical protein